MTASDVLPRPETRAAGNVRTLTPTECRRRIADHVVARLGFETGRGHRCVVVGYAVATHDGVDEALLVLPEYHPATGYVVGAPVTLEVEDRAEGRWETVRASGVAYLDAAPDARVQPYGSRWPDGVATHEVRVPLDRVEGVVDAG